MASFIRRHGKRFTLACIVSGLVTAAYTYVTTINSLYGDPFDKWDHITVLTQAYFITMGGIAGIYKVAGAYREHQNPDNQIIIQQGENNVAHTSDDELPPSPYMMN